MSQETHNEAGFVPEGWAPFPSLYADERRVAEFSAWSDAVLQRKFQEYADFLEGDIMPRARATAERIANHLVFEMSYREGFYQ